MSINEPIGYDKDGDEITLLDILKTPNPNYVLDIHKKDNIKLITKYFKILTNREQEIIIKRYGLNNQKELTQKEIAKQLGISRSYVSRIEKRALTKIFREFIKNDGDPLVSQFFSFGPVDIPITETNDYKIDIYFLDTIVYDH